ncbi:MAG TPA: hypothetical protein VLX92_35275 [Kofleriaceae bacterium]|nr:hypothetical protein [Kofleriaceae bacterium]
MIARLALALALAAALPALAEAGSLCHDRSTVLGYRHCRRFGAWSHPVAMWWDFGATVLHYDPQMIDATASAVHGGDVTQYRVIADPSDHRGVTALGARMASHLALPGGWLYIGAQMDLAPELAGPRLIADVTARGTSTTLDSASSGYVMSNEMLVGARVAIGGVVASTELAPGVRFAQYATSDLPDRVTAPVQTWFVLELHQKLELWLGPHTSVGVELGVDLLHTDAVEGGVTFGVHLEPFGGIR